MAQKKPVRPLPRVTWAQAVRDIFIASINRGQLPILFVGAIIALIIWKMPEEDVSKFAFEFLDLLKNNEMWAYVLLVVVLIGWFIHAKLMRNSVNSEFERIGREKSALQGKVAGTNFRSSDRA